MKMSGMVVTETAVRSIICELLRSDVPAVSNEMPFQDNGCPIDVNSEIDTTYRAFDGTYEIPVGTDIVPHDKRELEAVIKAFLVGVPNTSVPKLFHKIQRAFDEVADDDEGVPMKKVNASPMQGKNIEESLRKAIRKLIEGPEMKSALNFSGYDVGGDSDDDEPLKRKRDINLADKSDPSRLTYAQLAKKRGELDAKKSGMSPEEIAAATRELDDEDPREMSHDEMLPYMGHAGVTGVKGEEYKTIQKAKFLADMDPKTRSELIGTARDEYVQFLADGGDLEPEEVDMLKKHPAAVEELEGFRDWLDAYVWNDLEDEDPVHYIPGKEYDAIRADKLSKGIEPAWPKGPKGEPVHKKGDWADKQRAQAANSVRDREKDRNKEKKAADKAAKKGE